MKILIVCSANSARIAPFVLEQGEALAAVGVIVEYFTIQGKGISGYLRNYKGLIAHINQFKPDLIHAHYGLSGLLANIQRHVPVVTTYHGSDINSPTVYPFSRVCMMLSAYNIFVSEKNRIKSGASRNQSVIPCGVDINLFCPVEKELCRNELGWDNNKKYLLFAGSFNNTVKNAELALDAVAAIPEIELLEMTGYSREQVALMMNAVDAALMTSYTEGSPQFIKEAMACNCPIVSVPVGDVPEMIQQLEGCFISTYEPADVTDKLRLAIREGKRTVGRQRIIDLKLDSLNVAKRILEVYKSIFKTHMVHPEHRENT
jgi:glycosyltransferase involved in cell wall biosynthesis